MDNQEQRHRIVLSALSMTENTMIAPTPYERHLLAQFVQGALTIEQVIELLEVRDFASATMPVVFAPVQMRQQQ